MVRISAHNDWVIIILLVCISAYVAMFTLLLRGISIREFILQTIVESSNIFFVWIIVSLVYATVFGVLFSQFIPKIPNLFKFSFYGFELNKFGYTFLVMIVFLLLKSGLCYLFYAFAGNIRKWSRYYFAATKFYFCITVLMMCICIVEFYFETDRGILLQILFGLAAIAFIFKTFYLLIRKETILPIKWYYKILYICTLQIIPVLALWSLLFF